MPSPARLVSSTAFALLASALVPAPAQALSGRLGSMVAEGPGAWLQVRHPVAGTDLGIHLAASTIQLDVLLYNGLGPKLAGTVNAQFFEWGVVLGRPVFRSDAWTLEVNTGFQGGLLDGTQDEGGRPLARTMILVPLHLDGIWHPLPDHRRFGLTFGAGGVWTTPGDEDNLYPEVSAWRWQARTGLVF